jgi:hypothetical protein
VLCGRVVAGAVDRFADVHDSAFEVGDDLHVLPGHVFLAGEQPVMLLSFSDRGDEPVDQHAIAAGSFEVFVDLGAVHPAQDRLQDLLMLSIDPGERLTMTLHAEGQYQFVSEQGFVDTWPTTKDGLTTGAEDWMSVLTGTRYGPITVELAHLENPPGEIQTDYEMVVERDIEVVDHKISILELFRSAAGQFRTGFGVYRVRISVRQRQEAHDAAENGPPIEEHLIQIWVVPDISEPATLVGPDTYARTYLRQLPGGSQ